MYVLFRKYIYNRSSLPNTDKYDNDDGDKDDKDKDDGDKGDKYEYRPSGSKKKSAFRRTFGVITCSMSRKGKEKQSDDEFLNNMKNYQCSQFSFSDDG